MLLGLNPGLACGHLTEVEKASELEPELFQPLVLHTIEILFGKPHLNTSQHDVDTSLSACESELLRVQQISSDVGPISRATAKRLACRHTRRLQLGGLRTHHTCALVRTPNPFGWKRVPPSGDLVLPHPWPVPERFRPTQ